MTAMADADCLQPKMPLNMKNMEIVIYDHKIEDSCKMDLYVSFGYVDANRSKDANFIFLEKGRSEEDHFLKTIEHLHNFSNVGQYVEDLNTRYNIKELTSIDGVSLWWFIEINLRNEYESYLKYLDMLESNLDRFEISSITSNVHKAPLQRAIETYSNGKGIPLVKMHRRSLKNIKIRSIISLLRYTVEAIITYIINIFIYGTYKKRAKTPLIIASYTNYWTKYNVTRDIPKDGIFNEIRQVLDQDGIKYTCLEFDNESLRKYIRVQLEKNRFEAGKWIPLTSYIDLRLLLRAAKTYWRMASNIFAIHAQDEDSAFIIDFVKEHIAHYFNLVISLYMLRKALKIIEPRAILASCEYCSMGRLAIIAGDEKGIPTIAMQHGVITRTHEGCIFSKQEKTTFNSDADRRPLPRYTLLYGNKYKEILSKNSTYPQNSLIVTGQPRYDLMYNLKKSFDKSQFMEQYKLQPPIIVWMSDSTVLSEIETQYTIESFLRVLEDMPEICLFIKPHPIDPVTAIYDPLLKYKNVILSKEVNTYHLIEASSLVITKDSTTGMEAVALNKPLIVLNLSGTPDVVDYVEEGVALGVYREEELLPAIKKLLNDDRKLRENRDKYIEGFLLKVDGESSRRAAKFVEGVLEQKGQIRS